MSVQFQENNNRLVCFVNATDIPDRIEWLPLYKYRVDGEGSLTFMRMVKYGYLFRVDNAQILYEVNTFEEISVPLWKQALLKQCIDAMAGFES